MGRFTATDAAADCNCCGITRRGFLGSFAATAGASLFPAAAMAQPAPALTRIDTHHHYYPPQVMRSPGLAGPFIASWTPAKAIEAMDKGGVQTSILSMASAPGQWFKMETGESRSFMRHINDYGAQMMRDYPGRFGLFAYLSMVDTEGSLKEIEYVFDTLKADGVGLSTSYIDKYPGDAKFAPIFEELNRRKPWSIFTRQRQPAAPAYCQASMIPGSRCRMTQAAR